MLTIKSHTYGGSALERWKIGHRLFFVELQMIILAIKEYEEEPNEEKIRNIANLIRGSAATMQFTADFAVSAYEEIRESMGYLDADFSGLFSSDHRIMINELKKLKGVSEKRSRAYCELKDAIEVIYKAHALVCQRFVGDAGSLANSKTVAHETLLSRFMRRTLGRIGAINFSNRHKERSHEEDYH